MKCNMMHVMRKLASCVVCFFTNHSARPQILMITQTGIHNYLLTRSVSMMQYLSPHVAAFYKWKTFRKQSVGGCDG